jgi:guanylate kinase
VATSPRALVLSAPSGTGKTTLAKRLVAVVPGARLSVSATTRAPRGQEQEGKDYYFVNGARFDEMVARNELLEWAVVHGQRYGTPRSSLQGEGSWVVLDIDVQGGAAIKSQLPQTVTVLLLPPSWADLETRLRGRQTDSPEVIRQRLAAARQEIDRGLASYDYVVINGELDQALQDLQAVTRGEGSRRIEERSILRRRFGLDEPA